LSAVRIVSRDGYHSSWIEEIPPPAGAYKPGTRVRKVVTEPGDTHPVGSLATVLSAVGHPELGIAYFVEWDAHPKLAVLVVAPKIAAVS
jgi:hypothetical protein